MGGQCEEGETQSYTSSRVRFNELMAALLTDRVKLKGQSQCRRKVTPNDPPVRHAATPVSGPARLVTSVFYTTHQLGYPVSQ